MNNRHLIALYSVSPLHAGAGTATGAVDLPIQRERHTGWPLVQASGVKGAMRDAFRRATDQAGESDTELEFVLFGREGKSEQQAAAGALVFSDARVMAFPVRSNAAPFVWITCPAVLSRLAADLELLGMAESQQIDSLRRIAVKREWASPVTGDDYPQKILVEEWPLEKGGNIELPVIRKLFPLLTRLVVVDNQVFDYAVSQCTEVQAQIKIDPVTGTAADGALRYQELLPADTQLYVALIANRGAGVFADNNNSLAADLKSDSLLKNFRQQVSVFMQLGGDWTLGRGLCRIEWPEA